MSNLILGWATILGGFLAIAAAARAVILSSKEEAEETKTRLKEELKLRLADFLKAIDGNEDGTGLAPVPLTFVPTENGGEASYLSALSTYADNAAQKHGWDIRSSLDPETWISVSSPIVNFKNVASTDEAKKAAKDTILKFGEPDFLISVREYYGRLGRLGSRLNGLGRMTQALSVAIIWTLIVIVADMASLYFDSVGKHEWAWMALIASFVGFFPALVITAFYERFNGPVYFTVFLIAAAVLGFTLHAYVDPPSSTALDAGAAAVQAGGDGSAKTAVQPIPPAPNAADAGANAAEQPSPKVQGPAEASTNTGAVGAGPAPEATLGGAPAQAVQPPEKLEK